MNDGSTDGSELICEEYAKNSDKIIYISQENQGLSMARNVGITNSNGDWILFVDSDDCLEPTMVEELHSLAIRYDADISSCSFSSVRDNKESKKKLNKTFIKQYDYSSLIDGLVSQKEIRFEVWNKLWKKSIIGNVRFKKRQISEDIYFDHMIFKKNPSFVYINKKLYNYTISRPGNTNSSFKIGKISILDELEDWYIDLTNNNQFNEAERIIEIYLQFCQSLYSEAKFYKQDKEILNTINNKFIKYYKKCKHKGIKNVLFRLLPNVYFLMSKIRKKSYFGGIYVKKNKIRS